MTDGRAHRSQSRRWSWLAGDVQPFHPFQHGANCYGDGLALVFVAWLKADPSTWRDPLGHCEDVRAFVELALFQVALGTTWHQAVTKAGQGLESTPKSTFVTRKSPAPGHDSQQNAP